MPAGNYRLVLIARGGVLRHSEEVEVSWDRELLIELETGRVAGQVLDIYGAAVGGVRVTLRPVTGGRTTIPNVTAGVLSLRVETADGRSWSGSVQVQAGMPSS